MKSVPDNSKVYASKVIHRGGKNTDHKAMILCGRLGRQGEGGLSGWGAGGNT